MELPGTLIRRHISFADSAGTQGAVVRVAKDISSYSTTQRRSARHNPRAVLPYDASTGAPITQQSVNTTPTTIRVGDVLVGVDGQRFAREEEFSAALHQFTAPWHFGRRTFQLTLLRRLPDPSDQLNHGAFVSSQENEHAFWMYGRVEEKLDTIDRIKEGLGLGLQRMYVCVHELAAGVDVCLRPN